MLLAPSLPAAVALLSEEPYASAIESVFVIGGAAAFTEALRGGGGVVARTVYLTRVLTDVACDVFIPPLDDAVHALAETGARRTENGVEFQMCTYKHRQLYGLVRSPRPTVAGGVARHEEYQYLDAIR